MGFLKDLHFGCDMSFFDQHKHDFIIAVASFLGSMTAIGNKAQQSFKTSAVIAFTGVSVAVFFTPVISDLPFIAELGVKTGNRSDYAIAYFIGTSGWMGIIWAQKKFFKNNENETTADN